jgi:hypothetical protein
MVQGDIQLPMLWSLHVDKLLRGLKNGCRTLEYADDIAIRTSGKFPNTISQLLQEALGVVKLVR